MIKIGSDQTGHSGVLTCVTDLPGDVTLSASPAGVTLTPSSFTVGGTVANKMRVGCGIGAWLLNDDTLSLQNNFAIGLEFMFLPRGNGSWQGVLVNRQYNINNYNWAIYANDYYACWGFYQTKPTSVGYFYPTVFTKNVKHRTVFVFGETTVTQYWGGGSRSLEKTIQVAPPFGPNTSMRTSFGEIGEATPNLYNMQIKNGIPDAASIAAYIAGGDLVGPLALNLDMLEESGEVCFDKSGNLKDFVAGPLDARVHYLSQITESGFAHTLSGLTGNEQSITYDTGSIPPGTAITVKARRTKVGFPTGRTPDISYEEDTCVITAAAPADSFVDGVSVDKPTTSLDIGATETLGFTIYPSTAVIRTVTWVSSAPTIATIHPTSGLVTGVADGSAIMTATTDDGGFTDTCTVHVPEVDTIGVSLNKGTMSLVVGEDEFLSAYVWPPNASYRSVVWSSSDPLIATVDAVGHVRAISNGNAVITVTTVSGGFTATCVVAVVAAAVVVSTAGTVGGSSSSSSGGSEDQDPRVREDVPSLDTIDGAVLTWLEEMNIFSHTNQGWERVPVKWVGSERAYQMKRSAEERDRSGTLNYPIISVARKGHEKDPNKKGTFYSNLPFFRDNSGQGVIHVAKSLKAVKSSEFANNQSFGKTGMINYRFNEDVPMKTHEYQSIPLPIYLDTPYEIHIVTNYIQQMNEIKAPFMTLREAGNRGAFKIKYDGWVFEAFMGTSFAETNNLENSNEDERKIECKIALNILGYMTDEGENSIQPHIVKTEGVSRIRLGLDFGDGIEKLD